MNFKNIRIGRRLGIGFGILGLMMIVLVIAGIAATSMMNSQLEEITKVNYVKTQAAYDAMDALKSFVTLPLWRNSLKGSAKSLASSTISLIRPTS